VRDGGRRGAAAACAGSAGRGGRPRRARTNTCPFSLSQDDGTSADDDDSGDGADAGAPVAADDDDGDSDADVDGEEEDEDEDDEEEEEEEEAPAKKPAPKRKKPAAASTSSAPAAKKKRSSGKRRMKASAFVDVMAAVDEEEDEDESDGGDDGFAVADDDREVGAAASAAEARLAAREADRARQEMTAEQIAEMVEARYGRRARDAAAAAVAAPGGPSSGPRRLPTHADPKLWLVAARGGHEREACVQVLQKAADLVAAGTPLGIASAFCHDHLKGFIYVEAHKEAHVGEAVRGLRSLYSSKAPILVPLREMGDALTVAAVAGARIARGSWVRIRGGALRGDLARVVDADPAAGRATIQVVPRIDWAAVAARDRGEKPRPAAPGAARPPPLAFSLADGREAGAAVKRTRTRDGRVAYYLNDKNDQL
jgi:transcription elongation factor SPT5